MRTEGHGSYQSSAWGYDGSSKMVSDVFDDSDVNGSVLVLQAFLGFSLNTFETHSLSAGIALSSLCDEN
jgi:hypothetical protein